MPIEFYTHLMLTALIRNSLRSWTHPVQTPHHLLAPQSRYQNLAYADLPKTKVGAFGFLFCLLFGFWLCGFFCFFVFLKR